jgi:N-acetylmuramoyl-L-alanine amidase
MPVNHTIRQGETLTLIASQNGFRDWRTIYNDPANAAFRTKRPNPDVLFPGDVIIIPDKQHKTENAPTGTRTKFATKSMKLFLRVTLKDFTGKPPGNRRYTLRVDGQSIGPIARRTKPNGLIEQEVPFGAKTARIRIANCIWDLDLAHLNPMDRVTDNGVTGVQGRLGNLGYDVGPVDGHLGPKTRAALRRFQQDQGLPAVTGQLDSATEAALIAKHGC